MSNATMMNNGTVSTSKRGLRWVAAGLVLAISATVALSAWAMPGGGHGRHGGGMGGMGSHGMFMGSPEHMGRGIDRMLDGLNATEAQRAQIKQIAQQAATDLKGQRDTARALRQQSMQLFTAPNVDAAAAESLRQQMLTHHDASSRRMLQAMLDVSRVLTPEQRAKLGEQMAQRHQRMQERFERMQREQPAR
ncbi:MAG TPA: Spy/CpxP family protein refolding chaperone [Albitalea sp.]